MWPGAPGHIALTRARASITELRRQTTLHIPSSTDESSGKQGCSGFEETVAGLLYWKGLCRALKNYAEWTTASTELAILVAIGHCLANIRLRPHRGNLLPLLRVLRALLSLSTCLCLSVCLCLCLCLSLSLSLSLSVSVSVSLSLSFWLFTSVSSFFFVSCW